MSNFNKVILLGRLTKDPEFKELANGGLAKFSLAVNRIYKVDEEKKEETLFINCDLFGKQASTFVKFMTKGRSVLVEGRLRQDKWSTEDGTEKQSIVVNVESFQFVGDGVPSQEEQPMAQKSKPATPSKVKEKIPF